MIENISIAKEKSRMMAFANASAALLITYLSFWGLSGICFGILELVYRLDIVAGMKEFRCDWGRFFYQPWYLFELYENWWKVLIASFRIMNVRPILFVPFVVPFVMVITLMLAFIKRNYSFRLWYVLNHRFAKLKDIKKMGLTKELFMVLGRFENKILGVRPTESILCIGEMGTGKTSSVAIPSVLRSDNACIIAVDMTGLLPKYTAGYRSNLGKIFYYNWDLLDEPDKGLFYARWNPLAKENVPDDSEQKNAYIKRIAGYLADVDEEQKDNYWNLLAHSIIAAFLEYWISKVNQAKANDYFLEKLLEGRNLSRDEKDILLSYYIQMPKSYAQKAIENLEDDLLDKDNYLPIGSWAGIPEHWIGHDACFAAITDWIIDCYMTAKDENGKDWKEWLEALLREAIFFGYGDLVINGIKQFLFLSQKQRHLAFACAIKPFRIFTNQAIRERTNGNDFNITDIRGIYDDKNQVWKPVTVYSLANTHASKILNQMFLDEVMYRNLHLHEKQGPLPVVLVLDDVGHNLKLKNLTELLMSGKAKKMSALLLCNSFSLVENTYSKEELECLVMNTNYKIIKAPNNQKLSRQLDKLATFATKSVQIPRDERRNKKKGGKYFANAYYFHRLAIDFNLNKKNIQIDTRKHQIVLVEGYYNRPILADNIFFAEDERFRKLAVLDAEYCLSENELSTKTALMLETPKIAEVFNQKDLGVDDLVELDQYMNVVFEEVKLEIDADKKSAKTKANASVSAAHIDKEQQRSQEKDKDWWLEEDAFKVYENEDKNPFRIKK